MRCLQFQLYYSACKVWLKISRKANMQGQVIRHHIVIVRFVYTAPKFEGGLTKPDHITSTFLLIRLGERY
jgi:hypothetical protein